MTVTWTWTWISITLRQEEYNYYRERWPVLLAIKVHDKS